MTKKNTIVLLVVFGVLFSSFSEKINWSKDIDSALKAAEKNDTFIMIDVYTDWCSWCTTLDEETYSDKKVIELSKQFVNLKLNPERSESERVFAEGFNVTGYPTILFIDKNRQLVGRIGGFLPAKEFYDKMEAVLGAKKLDGLYEAYKKGDINSALQIVDILSKLERTNEAIPLLLELDKQKKLPAKDILVYYNQIGLYYLESGESDKAFGYFQSNLDTFSLDDDNLQYVIAIYYTAYLMGQKGEVKEAKKILNFYIKNNQIEKRLRNYLVELKKSLE